MKRVKEIIKALACSEWAAYRIVHFEQAKAERSKIIEERKQLERAKTDPEEFKKLLMKAMKQK